MIWEPERMSKEYDATGYSPGVRQMPKLKSCPFCGGPAELWKAQGNRAAWVACMGQCVVLVTRECKSNDEAVALWNGRAQSEEP